MNSVSKARPERTRWILSGKDDPTAAKQYLAAIATVFDIELLVSDEDFANDFETVNLAGALLGRSYSGPQTYVRTPAHIQRDGMDHIHLMIYSAGEFVGEYDGKAVHGFPDQLHFVEMDRPFHTTLTAFTLINLMLPRAEVDEAGPRRDLHGLTLSGDIASVRLVINYLRFLWEVMDELTADEASTAVKAAISLIQAVVRNHAPLAAPDASLADQALVTRVRQFVDRRIGFEDLAPGYVAEEMSISRATLYRAFKPHGGVLAFIRNRRLERVFDILTGAEGPTTNLSDIAYAHGFRSDAHFSRAFSARYGIPPGRLRGVITGHRSERLDTGRALELMSWLRTL